ncbi:MAG: DUF5916 domain-containing protein [Piscinibacter sp.]
MAAGRGTAQPQAFRPGADSPPLKIDGRLDEAAWQAAPLHDSFVQFLPRDRQPVPDGYRTTMQIVIEEHALVVGIRAWDPRPEEIRAPLMRRDKVTRDQDFVSVIIDPVGTRRSAQFVRINAAGVIADGMFIAATDTEDFAPDFEVEAAVQRLADGYSVELRLPLMTLRYPYEGGAPWRIMATRSIPREFSTLLLSAPLTKDALNFIAELQPIAGLDDIAERVRAHALLSVRPELTLRSTRRDDGATVQRQSRGALGAEIKWRPRADWVFDATLNPDFSQVELDVPQLAGNTRFALSVPEKRPFFLESTDVIDLPLAAFYSRSVTDPGWGLRSTWRGTGADATALSLRDDGGGLLLRPGPYATAVLPQDRRSQATLVRGRWHGESFSAGALLSQRDESDGGAHNRVAGVDWVWRPSDEQQWRARAMGSRSRDSDGAPGDSGHHLNAAWWMRVPGWNLTAEATEVSPRFRNDNGFVEQAGVRILQSELIRRWGEVALPGPLGFDAHEFETYLWMQHKSTLADRDVPGGQTIARSAHAGIWLVAVAQHRGLGACAVRHRTRAQRHAAALGAGHRGELQRQPGTLADQAARRDHRGPAPGRRGRPARPRQRTAGRAEPARAARAVLAGERAADRAEPHRRTGWSPRADRHGAAMARRAALRCARLAACRLAGHTLPAPRHRRIRAGGRPARPDHLAGAAASLRPRPQPQRGSQPADPAPGAGLGAQRRDRAVRQGLVRVRALTGAARGQRKRRCALAPAFLVSA